MTVEVQEVCKDMPRDSHSDSGEAAITSKQADQQELADDNKPSGIKMKGVRSKMSRNEKKTRKSLSKLGLKYIEGADRIIFKKANSTLFILENPDLYKSGSSDTYIIFGDVKVDDISQSSQSEAIQSLKEIVKTEGGKTEAPPPKTVDSDDDQEVDPGDLNEKDIEMVMTQANCSKSKAIKALKSNNKDVVDAIMALSE